MKNVNFLTEKMSYLSKMVREWFENDSVMTRERLGSVVSRLCLASLICLCMLTIGVGNVWGALSSPYTCTFTAGMSMSGSNCTTGDVTWTISTTTGTGSPGIEFGNQNGQSCIKLGAGKKNYYSSMTLTTSAFSSYQVSEVVLYISSNNGGSKTITVTQGSTTIGTKSQSFTTTTWVTNSTYNTNTGTSGDLSITISSDATATFIHSIKVTYSSTPSCSTPPTVGSSLTSVSATANSITATVPISAIGGCNITENGLVYSTSVATPTVGAANCYTTTTTACGGTAANKTVTISDLACGTSYYVRGYATNAANTSYTNVTTQSTSACPLYTITYNAGSGTCGTANWAQTSAGQSTTLPTASPSTACEADDWEFAGWCTDDAGDDDDNTTSPGTILTGSYTPTGNITLYAVYTKTSGGGGSFDPSSSVDGDYYITNSDHSYYMNHTVYSSSYFEATAAASKSESANLFHITKITEGGDAGKFVISFSDNGTKYVRLYNNGSSNVAVSTDTYANASKFSIAASTMTGHIGTYEVKHSDSRALMFRSQNSGESFRNYATSNGATSGYSFIEFESTGATYYMTSLACAAASTWKFKYSGDSWTEHVMSESAGIASFSINLAADSRFEFGIDDNGTFYKNNGTIITTTSGWVFNTSDNNCKIHTGPAGTYTFAINTTTKSVTVTYPEVSHPNEHYVYFKNTSVWPTVKGYLGNTENDNKAAAWPGSDMQATTTICGETYHYAALNAMSGTYNLIIFNNGSGAQTSDLSTTGSLGKFNANQDANWHNLQYSITFANGGGSGSMTNVTGICPGSNVTLPANEFTKSGNTFTGWTANVAVTIGGSSVSAGTLIPDVSTIQSIGNNITLTANWEVSADYILVESAGDIGEGDYLIVYNNTYALNTHDGNINTNTYGTYTNISSYYSSKQITSNSTTDALAFSVETTTNGYSFYKESEGTYLGNNSTSTGAKLRWDDSFAENQNEWTLGVNSMISVYDDTKAIRWNNNSGSYRFAIYATDGQQEIQLFKKAYEGPTIIVSADLDEFTYERGKGPSAAQSFTVRGKLLTGDLTVTAPTGYEVSLDGFNWASSKTITASGKLSSTTVYLRLAADLIVGDHNGNVTISGEGATTRNIAVEGSVTCATPVLSFASGVVTKYADAANFTNPLTISGVAPSDVTVTYSSSDPAKASVNSSTGEVDVKAVTEDGTPVTITASVDAVAGANCTSAAVASYSLVIGHKITWIVNTEEYTEGVPTLAVASGGSIDALPEAPDGTATCGNKVFVGWTESSSYSNSTTPPGDLFSSPGGAPTPITSNKTFYAVFADSPAANTYYEATKSELINGTTVIIVNTGSGKAMTHSLSGTDVTIAGTTCTTSAADVLWTIEDDTKDKGWIYIRTGSNYLIGLRENPWLKVDNDEEEIDSWYIVDDEGYYVGYYNYSTEEIDRYLEYYNGNFTTYTYNSTHDSQYTMKFYIPHYSNYATTCTTPWVVTVNSAGHGSVEADPIYVVDGSSTTLTLTPDAGYECSSVTLNSGTATEGTLSGNTYTLTNITSDVDLTAAFSKAPVYSVTFNAGDGKVVGYNANTATLTEVTRSYGVTAPSATSCAEDWKFAYWSTTDQTTETTVAPTRTAEAGQKYVPSSANETLYAVYMNINDASYSYGTDQITVSDLAATNTTYVEFSNVAKTTAARYAGKSGKNHGVIALNSTKPAGIVSTTSGGALNQVTVHWDSNTTETRTIAIYGYNTPYVNSYDIYGTSNTTPKGYKLGELTYDGSAATNTLDVSGNYTYVGIRSKSGALYLSQIDIKWTTSATGIKYHSHPTCDECNEPTYGFELSSVTLTYPRGETYTNTFNSNNTNAKTYTSSNPSVAVVNSNGEVTLKGKGTTTISVHQNRMTTGSKYCYVDDSYELIVNEAGVDVVEVNNNNQIIIEHDFGGETNVLIDQLTLHEEGKKAEEVFFSKYFEATGSVKLVALYNGTGKSHDPSKYRIRCASTKASTQHIIKVGDYVEEWPNGKELVFYSWDTDNSNDLSVMSCVTEKNDNGEIDMSEWISIPWTGWTSTKSAIIFGGSDAVILEEYDGSQWNILDIIGAVTADGKKADGTNLVSTSTITWGDNENKGWYCASGQSLEEGHATLALSTLRCLLVRKFDVLSGKAARNATTGNLGTGYFNTLCTEWYGKQVTGTTREQNNASACNSFSEVGNFNYYNAYQKYEELNTSAFSATPSSPWDGTMTISINPSVVPGGLAGLSCNYLKIKVTNSDRSKVKAEVEYKVPIIVDEDKNTDNAIFTKFDDCSICDVAILQDGTLTAVSGGKNEVSDVEVYRGAKLSIPSGQEYTVNNLYLRSLGDVVPQLDVIGTLNRANTKLYFDKRVDESQWYWMTLPYDCNVADVTLRSGETPTYGIGNDWVLQTYDGQKRAETRYGGCWKVFDEETIQKGVGYILGVTPKSGHDYVELRFPMIATAWDKDAARATIDVPVMGTQGESEGVPVNDRGWNLVGNPYLTNYNPGHIGETTIGSTNIIPQGLLVEKTGEGFHYDEGDEGDEHYQARYMNVPVDGGYSEYRQVAIGDQPLPPFMSYFIQVQGSDGDIYNVKFSNTLDQYTPSPVRRRMPEVEDNHIVWVPFNVKNSNGESDETTLLVSNRFTDGYDMMDDLIKWRGDYYQYSSITTKPVLATRNTSGEMAFNALPDTSASVTGIPVNFFAAYAGDYTFSINGKYGLDEVKEAQLWDATTQQYYNLLADDYTFTTAQGENDNRFILYVRVERKKAPNQETDVDNILDGKLSLITIDKMLVLSGLTDAADVYVYDMSGKLMNSDHTSGSGGIWRTTVPATGAYFVRVNSANGQQTLRAIVK